MKAEERRLEKAQERSAHWRRWGEDGLAGISDNHQRLCPTGSHRLLNLFHEHFHGDEGRGIGASHRTGRTALVARPIEQSGE
ncbi:MAG TPA: hypothetical protein VF136_18655 [Methylomirabilota bacterium]